MDIKIALLRNEAMMPRHAGNINMIEIIWMVSFPAVVFEYGFQNNNKRQRIIHPTEATTALKRGFLKFI